jgi:xylan 1,4-beta-xylosidase
VSRLDATHGSPLASYDAMGRPAYPTEVQIVELRKAAQLRHPEKLIVHGGAIHLVLPAQGLALIELR